jgi:serine/threonine protein kinase
MQRWSMQEPAASRSPQDQTLNATRKPDPTMLPLDPSDLVGRTLPGDLCVLARLNETPEGYLYSARSPAGREVALLIPPLESNREHHDGSDPWGHAGRQALEERIRRVSQIDHPNVAEIYETGELPNGLYYIVLEPLIGELLSSILAERGPCPLGDAVDICLQASAGLAAAHTLGIVHGNMSPQTILVAGTADLRPRVKLIGFSLGPFLPGAGPEQWESARYASVEQVGGIAGDEQSDVFSLGAILHHLLSGAPPESGTVADSIPRNMRRPLTRALADSRARRFRSVSEFARALEQAAEVANRPRPRWAGRTLLRGTAAAILIVAVALGLLWRWQPRPESTGVLSARTDFRGVEVGASSVVAPAPAPEPAPVERARAREPATSRAPIAKAETMPDTAAAQLLVSPYRRSHPWAAPPGGRFYYRSSCPEALRFTDLLFFTSEREARAKGFVPSPIPGCH